MSTDRQRHYRHMSRMSRRQKHRAVFPLIVFILLILLVFWGNVERDQHRRVPRCSEDSVLVGTGEFNAGLWDSYSCGPAVDDYCE